MTDCSPPGGERQSFAELMLEQSRTGLLLGQAWSLVDLPPTPEVPPTSEAEQVAGGQLGVYSCAIPPECVLDWNEGRDGKILWGKTCFVSRHQADPFSPVVMVHEDYTFYTETSWVRFEVRYDADQQRAGAVKKPEDATKIVGVVPRALVPPGPAGPHAHAARALPPWGQGQGAPWHPWPVRRSSELRELP